MTVKPEKVDLSDVLMSHLLRNYEIYLRELKIKKSVMTSLGMVKLNHILKLQRQVLRHCIHSQKKAMSILIISILKN